MTHACDFPGCPRPYHSHGLCSAHADQRRRGTTLKPVRGADPKPCSFPGCDRTHFGHGLCKTHMAQKDRGQPLTPIRPTAARGGQESCSAPCGCDRKADAKGLCKAHYQQRRAGKDLVPIGARKQRGERSPRRPYVPRIRTPRPTSNLPAGWAKPLPQPKPYRGSDKSAAKDVGPIRELADDEIARARHTVELMTWALGIPASEALEALGLVAA